MIHLRCGLALALLSLIASTAMAQDTAPAWSIGTEIWSKYVGGPHGAVPYKYPVSQTNLNVSWENCLSVNLWASKALGTDSASGNGGNEVDYTVQCRATFGNGFGGHVSVNYYDLSAPVLYTSSRGDFVQLGSELNYTAQLGQHTLVPYVGVERW